MAKIQFILRPFTEKSSAKMLLPDFVEIILKKNILRLRILGAVTAPLKSTLKNLYIVIWSRHTVVQLQKEPNRAKFDGALGKNFKLLKIQKFVIFFFLFAKRRITVERVIYQKKNVEVTERPRSLNSRKIVSVATSTIVVLLLLGVGSRCIMWRVNCAWSEDAKKKKD